MSKFRANPWAMLLVVSLGYFMTLLEITTICTNTNKQRGADHGMNRGR
jgi:hypothetical protein